MLSFTYLTKRKVQYLHICFVTSMNAIMVRYGCVCERVNTEYTENLLGKKIVSTNTELKGRSFNDEQEKKARENKK